LANRHDLVVCRPDVGERQVQREGAAAAVDTAQANLTAEQMGELAADGESQPRAAVFSRRASIGLLEGLEDDLLLLRRDADTGVADGKLDDRRRLAEDGMLCGPASGGHPDMQPDAAAVGELERIG